MSFTLYYPTKSSPTKTIVLPSPEFSNVSRNIGNQALGRARGGQRYSYTHGVERTECDYRFTDLTETQHDDLLEFFTDYAERLTNSFQIDDHHSDTFTCYFLSPDMEFENTGETDPPDDDPVFNVAFSLEQTPVA